MFYNGNIEFFLCEYYCNSYINFPSEKSKFFETTVSTISLFSRTFWLY